MKKTTTILMLSVLLLANTEIGQLLKLPVLIHHYLEHHDDGNNGVSFAEFVHEHYSDHHQHPSENGEHEKLPFKNCDVSFLQTVTICEPPLSFIFETPRPVAAEEKTHYEVSFYSSLSLSNIWQPPRSC